MGRAAERTLCPQLCLVSPPLMCCNAVIFTFQMLWIESSVFHMGRQTIYYQTESLIMEFVLCLKNPRPNF